MRYGGPDHLHLDALQRACDRLVMRHSALRTTLSRDEAFREAMDRAAAMWQLMLGADLRGKKHGNSQKFINKIIEIQGISSKFIEIYRNSSFLNSIFKFIEVSEFVSYNRHGKTGDWKAKGTEQESESPKEEEKRTPISCALCRQL